MTILQDDAIKDSVETQAEKINQFFSAMFAPNEYIEFRPIQDKTGGKAPQKARRWFTVNQLLGSYQTIVNYCREQRLAAFYGVAPRPIYDSGKKETITHARALWMDIDIKQLDRGSEELNEILERFAKLAPPSAILKSGGGVHVYYFLSETHDAEDVEEANRLLKDFCDGDNVQYRNALLRLPFSYHCKRHYIDGSEPIQTQLDISNLRYDLCDLVDIFARNPYKKPKQETTRSTQVLAFPTVEELAAGQGKLSGDTSPSGYDYALAREAAYQGRAETEIADLLRGRLEGRVKANKEDYIKRTINNAVASLKSRRSTWNKEETHYNDDLERYSLDHKTKPGELKKTLNNLVKIVESYIPHKIQHNKFKAILEFDGRRIKDSDLTRLRLLIYQKYGISYTADAVNDAVQYVAAENEYHPLRDYFNGLEWDKKPRLDNWMENYCGIKDNQDVELVGHIGRKWLISHVARIMKDRSKVDTSPILAGPQGIGKSTLLKILAVKEEYFRDTALDIRGGKDTYTKLQGVMIYEFAELSSTKVRDANITKAFISSETDVFRRAWGRFDEEVPRQCVFVGTTNEDEILRDPTGARRFPVVSLVGFWNDKEKKMLIKFDELIKVRDQLWAEAVQAFNNGEKWIIEGDFNSRMKQSQEGYQMTDTWLDAFVSWSNTQTKKEFTVKEILTGAIGIETGMQNRAMIMRMTGLLNQAGYEKFRATENKRRIYKWRKAKGVCNG